MKALALLLLPLMAAAADFPDLPPPQEVEAALESNIDVQTARTGISLEQSNKERLKEGEHEFNLRTDSASRKMLDAGGQRLREWGVALERPIRLPDKARIDSDIGDAGVEHAQYALGDARHEAGRALLSLWFGWLREKAAADQWEKQVGILKQQAALTEKRVAAGDAPRMEMNQANAALAQAGVSLSQARNKALLAANDLTRRFPALRLPERVDPSDPTPVPHDFAYWRSRVLADNHELGMMQSERQMQQLKARRSLADKVPDPTIGLRYSSEFGGNELVTGVYLIVPFSFGLRDTIARGAGYQAEISAEREAYVKRRLENDVRGVYAAAAGSYDTWINARDAAISMRQNADLAARAYSLGESSLSDVLIARRLSLESSLSETMARLDANESRYRLMLDAHELWAMDEHD